MKVLTYKSNAQDLTTKNWELIPTDSPTIFLHFVEEIYGRMGYRIVVKIADEYFDIEGVTIHPDHSGLSSEQIQQVLDWVDNIPNREYYSKLHLEMVRAMGGDLAAAVAKRDEYIARKEQEAADNEGARRLAEEEKAKKLAEKAAASLDKLKIGEQISFPELENVLDHYPIKLHPRTLGCIRSMSSTSRIGLNNGFLPKKQSQSTSNSLFKVVSDLAETY